MSTVFYSIDRIFYYRKRTRSQIVAIIFHPNVYIHRFAIPDRIVPVEILFLV